MKLNVEFNSEEIAIENLLMLLGKSIDKARMANMEELLVLLKESIDRMAFILEPVDDLTSVTGDQALSANLQIRDEAIKEVLKMKRMVRERSL